MERLFIALELNDSVKEKIRKLVNQLQEEGCTGKWVSEENYHITLAFIGDSDEAEKIENALSKVHMESFEFTIDGTLRFHQILALKIDSEKLSTLAEQVRDSLRQSGISFDQKRFKAHITLARKFRGPEDLIAFSETLQARKFALFKSEFTEGKRIYTPLYLQELSDPE